MQVLVLLTDHQTTRGDKKNVEEEVKEVKKMGVNIVPVGMGPRIDIQELERISGDGHKILHFGEYANPKTVGNSILHGMFIVDAGFRIKANIGTITEESVGGLKKDIEVMKRINRKLMHVFLLFFFFRAPRKGFSW